MLASFDGPELNSFAVGLRAFKLQHDLLGCLRFLVEDRLGLTTETSLLAVIPSLT